MIALTTLTTITTVVTAVVAQFLSSWLSALLQVSQLLTQKLKRLEIDEMREIYEQQLALPARDFQWL